MQSWSLESFIKEYSVGAAANIWGVSRQAVFNATKSHRDLRIIKTDGNYEVHESKILSTKPCSDIKFIKLVD